MDAPPFAAPIDDRLGGRRVVVGVDGSPESEQAVHWAAYLAGCSDYDIDAVIAWAPPTGWGAAWSTGAQGWDPEAEAGKQLDVTLERVLGESIPASVRRQVVEGSAARVLIEVSRGAAALVVGSRGHGGFAGLLLGSVSSVCAEHATCPVLVVHGDMMPPVPIRAQTSPT
jgi:nucleotide-binding universal stress UspA family protein